LLTMKTYVEGMRSLLYYVGMCDDKRDVSDRNQWMHRMVLPRTKTQREQKG